jgi:hypothetical protein
VPSCRGPQPLRITACSLVGLNHGLHRLNVRHNFCASSQPVGPGLLSRYYHQCQVDRERYTRYARTHHFLSGLWGAAGISSLLSALRGYPRTPIPHTLGSRCVRLSSRHPVPNSHSRRSLVPHVHKGSSWSRNPCTSPRFLAERDVLASPHGVLFLRRQTDFRAAALLGRILLVGAFVHGR